MEFMLDTEINTQDTSNFEILYFAIIKNGMPLFEMDFRVEDETFDSILIAGFISAISVFANELSKSDLKYIDQDIVKIGYEKGNYVSLYYIATEITDEIATKLQLILHSFEFRYHSNLEIPKYIANFTICDDFKEFVLHIFSEDLIKEYYVPNLNTTLVNSCSNKKTYSNIISFINGKRSVGEIALLVEEDLNNIIEKFAMLRYYGIIKFAVYVNDHDMFNITIKGIIALSDPNNCYNLPQDEYIESIYPFIKDLNGTTSIIELSNRHSIPLSKAKQLTNYLIMSKNIEKISEEEKSVLMAKQLYNSLLERLSRYSDAYSAFETIKNAIESSNSNLTNLINYSNCKINFDLLRKFTQETEVHNYELLESFLSPLVEVLKLIETRYSPQLRVAFASSLFEEIRNIFGYKSYAQIHCIYDIIDQIYD